jgi:hypothetical protein
MSSWSSTARTPEPPETDAGDDGTVLTLAAIYPGITIRQPLDPRDAEHLLALILSKILEPFPDEDGIIHQLTESQAMDLFDIGVGGPGRRRPDPPQPDDRRMSVSPGVLGLGEPLLGGVDRRCGVGGADSFGEVAPVRLRRTAQRGSHEMNHAQLHGGQGSDPGDRVRKPSNPSQAMMHTSSTLRLRSWARVAIHALAPSPPVPTHRPACHRCRRPTVPTVPPGGP